MLRMIIPNAIPNGIPNGIPEMSQAGSQTVSRSGDSRNSTPVDPFLLSGFLLSGQYRIRSNGYLPRRIGFGVDQ